jgi:hypothetical protein
MPAVKREAKFTCPKTGKVRHNTQLAAIVTKVRMPATERPLEPFYCSACEGWHLGKEKRSKQPKPVRLSPVPESMKRYRYS